MLDISVMENSRFGNKFEDPVPEINDHKIDNNEIVSSLESYYGSFAYY